jgi:hypothetical protein
MPASKTPNTTTPPRRIVVPRRDAWVSPRRLRDGETLRGVDHVQDEFLAAGCIALRLGRVHGLERRGTLVVAKPAKPSTG